MIEERAQQVLAKVFRRIAAKTNLSDGTAVEPLLVVKPRTDNQINVRGVGLLGLERFVERDIAVYIFLVSQAVHQHGGYRDAARR